MSERLARRYRWLLRIYPRGPRRDELLGTLLECAPPGRTRPTVRETVNLLRHGMRAQLGRPGSAAPVVFAVLIAFVCGLAAAGGAGRLMWETAPPLPTGTEADALKRTVFPGLTVWGGGDAPLFVPGGDGIRPGAADYWVKHTAETRDLRAYTDGVRDRLAAAGWRLRSDVLFEDEPDAVTPIDTVSFWASRDDLVLAYVDTLWGDRAWYDSDGAAAIELSRAEPSGLRAVALGAGLLGALIGWFLTGWVSRRTEHLPVRGLAVGVLAGVALVLMLPLVLTAYLTLGAAEPHHPPFTGFFADLTGMSGVPALLAAAIGVAILLIAARPGRPVLAVLAVTVAVTAGVTGLREAPPALAGAQPCAPTGPPAEPDPGDVRFSRAARVFIAQNTTPDQRNLIDAAIFRVWGVWSSDFRYDPTSREYRDAYCGGAPLAGGAGMRLPYFWDVDLSSPGVFPALVAEVEGMPGVLAVRQASPDQ